jgi:transcriptional regulator with XRE-family HTH domain
MIEQLPSVRCGQGRLGEFQSPCRPACIEALKFVPRLVCCTNLVIVIQSLFWDKITMNGAQVRMARAALKMNVRDLAAAAEVSPNTITRVEADLPSNATTMAAIRRVFEAAGIEFTNGGQPGVRLKSVAVPAEPASASKPATGAKVAAPKKTRAKGRR